MLKSPTFHQNIGLECELKIRVKYMGFLELVQKEEGVHTVTEQRSGYKSRFKYS